MRINKNFGQILPLGLLASTGVGVQYINTFFNANLRWLVLIFIFLGIILKGQLGSALRSRTAQIILGFTLYAVLSTTWSDLPLLSGPKSILQLITSISYFTLAVFWVRHREMNVSLNFLWSILCLAIIASAAGAGSTGSRINMNADIELYRGLSYNSNYLGILLMLSLPLPLWHSVRNDVSRRSKRIAIVVALFLGVMLLQTVSRASILSSSIILLFFLWGRGKTATMTIVALMTFSAILANLVDPQSINDFIFKFVQKGNQAEAIFYSREGIYRESIEAANAGGVFGLGFGVSLGFLDYQIGQGSALYGREKGNATLATIEELGIIGIFLFSAILLSVISSIATAISFAKSREERTILFLILGAIFGLLIHAQFEAWLLSPGAPATPVFWALIGIASELSRNIRNSSNP